jgi:protein SCO1/2
MKKMDRFNGRFVFLFALALSSWGVGDRPQTLADDSPKTDNPPAAYFRNLTLQTQDGKEVRFYEDLIKGKIVVINLMYTRCDGILCDQGTKNLVKLQNALGDRLGREVFIYSVTLDPEHDTPAILKEYATKYGVKPGWTFLTGDAKVINELRGKLGLYNSDPKKDADPTQHSGMIRIGNEPFDKWSTTSVLSSPDRILQIIERMKPPTPTQK